MSDYRYIRQTTLKEFGPEAQEKLANSSVLVVGVGGLGIPVLQYLNAMGVGTLGMVEQDIVDLSNLQRQVLYTEDNIGQSKLEVALEKLQAQNSLTSFKTYSTFLTRDNALEIIKDYDLVVDASDNFPTRYLVNDACVLLNKPFVYGALHSFEGQVSVFNYKGGPTYRCLFPKMPSSEEIPNCNENGVLGVIPGIVGNFQALEAVKVLAGVGEVLSGKLLLYSGLTQAMQKINFKRHSDYAKVTTLQQSYDTLYCGIEASVSTEHLLKLLKAKTTFQLIDVRTPEEFGQQHLDQAFNIPLDELSQRWNEIDPTQDTYLICQSGKRSQMALEQLQTKFKEATFFNVTGGINQYNRTIAQTTT
ncbi:ThiF family adenylyltransferase [Spongiimicrobium salis]|uniref:ThiF family adenylyltransferase n=1 Tax=Spongiimicrobium salis TaxID=1667022 RepID=UPI00374D6D6F